MSNSVELFNIETNREPSNAKVGMAEIPSQVIQAFGLPPSIKIFELTKGNPYSRIFEYHTPRNVYIIRSDTLSKHQQLEVQASILSDLSPNMTINPLRNVEGDFICQAGPKAWMTYPKLPGHQYNGNPALLSILLTRSIQLHQELEAISHCKNTSVLLPKCAYAPENWYKIWDWLLGCPVNDYQVRLQQAIPSSLKEFIMSNRIEFDESVHESMVLHLENDLVHYDLQHANILISGEGSVYFIDPEDIYWSDKRLAIFHGVFKWVRHCIYVDAKSRTFVMNWLRSDCIEIIEMELKEAFCLNNIRIYCQFRTLSDLYNLCNAVIHNGQVELLYDLEKKIQNLLEIRSLFK